jgi:hypothetical protein
MGLGGVEKCRYCSLSYTLLGFGLLKDTFLRYVIDF